MEAEVTLSLHTSQDPLIQIFHRNHQFEVPAFQRPYIWDVRTAGQLVDDLRSAMETPDVPYFLGSLVLVSKNGSARESLVIDGQQRLTTLTILLSALRDLEEDTSTKANLNEMILEPGHALQKIVPGPRLVLRSVDQQFLREFIQEGESDDVLDLEFEDLDTDAQVHMWENYRYIHKLLATEMTAQQRFDLAQYLSNQVNLVLVTSDDFSTAHRVFNVLNTRGIPLSAADILKSTVVGQAGLGGHEDIAFRWDTAMERVGEDKDSFLRDLYMVLSKKESKGSIATDFENDVLPRFTNTPQKSFVRDELEPYSQITQHIRAGQSPAYSAETNLWLTRLGDYSSSEWIPAAMWILRHRGSGPEAAALLRGLERVTGVETAAGLSASARRSRIMRLLRELEENPSTEPQYLRIDDDLRRRFIAALHQETPPASPMTTVLLLRANDRLAGEPVRRPRSFKVAQVIPTKNSDLPQWQYLTENQRQYWPRRLANLVLASSTTPTVDSGADYQARRTALAGNASTSFPLTDSLQEVAQWDSTALEARQQETIALIANFWDVREDSDKLDLLSLSHEQLTAAPGGTQTMTGRRITLEEVYKKGLLRTGDVFQWERPKLGVTYRAEVTANGNLQLADGNVYTSPSAAARAAGGYAAAGPRAWVRLSDGLSIKEIFDTYRKSVLGQ